MAQTAAPAQTNSALLATIQLYNTQANDPTAQQLQTQNDDIDYTTNIGAVRTVDDFIKNKSLVTYVLKAYGFDKKGITDDVLRKILTSDPLDPKSFVNQKGNTGYRALATAFNFGTDGKVLPLPKQQAQDRGDLVATADLYLRQSMEEEAGEQNQGVRLALYFQRNVSKITSPFSILADPALLQVVQTALGLPASRSSADIDLQATMITKKLNLDDLQDPKKLSKFLARFAALYDLNNSGYNPYSLATMLFQNR
jgi:hypothetical protein